jgi:hypothetical protein
METKGSNYWDVTAVLLRTSLGKSGGKATLSTKQDHTNIRSTTAFPTTAHNHI